MVNRTVLTIDVVPSLVRLTAILLLLWLPRVSLGQETAPLSQRDAVLPMQQVVPTRSSAPLVNPGVGA